MPYFRLSTAASLPRRSDVFALGYPGAASIPLTSEEDLQEALKDAEIHANVTSYFKPRDLDYSLTKGIVSKVISDPDGGVWLQHDTAISPGNSGGPLCLDDGTVVAINTRINPETAGISFSFVISQLRDVIDTLSKNSDWVD